ncbi:hypothetical protein FGB62_118g018 [Gracilaria domingensis]|nr:hypothetical protein FGB62_118g018 [Gracilaria domingensis]
MDFSEAELPPLNSAALPSAAQMFPDDEDEVQTSPPAISPTPPIAPSRDCIGRPAQPCDMSPQAEHESPAPVLTRQTTLPVRAAGNTRSILRPSPANRVRKTNTVSNGNARARSNARNRRGLGFTSAECLHFLKGIEDILPIGPNEWDSVAVRHCRKYPETGRSADSIRRKFNNLHRTPVPTGSPLCPPEVVKAKRVAHALWERMEISNDNEDVELEGHEASPVPAAGADDQQTAEEHTDVEAEMQSEVQERRLSNDENEVQFVPSNLPSRRQQQSVSMPFTKPRMKTRDGPSGIMELFQLNMLEEQKWRREQRELDRQREIAREARERAREEREAARQDRLLELMVISFGAQHKHYEAGSTKPNNTSGDH